MALTSLSDAELWSLIVSDDYRAFTVLFDRYWLKLFRIANKFKNLRNNDACEEVIHDLFVNLWSRRHHLVISDFNSYLKAAIRYQVYAYLKKSKASLLEYNEHYDERTCGVELNVGQENLLYSDLQFQLDEQIELLPKRCKEIFILSRKEHLTNTEIADKLNISKRSVENQLTNALKHLRYHLKDIGLIIILGSLNR